MISLCVMFLTQEAGYIREITLGAFDVNQKIYTLWSFLGKEPPV